MANPLKIELSAVVSERLAGKRLDQVLAELFPEYSRSRLQSWIKSGEVTVDNRILKQRDKVHVHQQITIIATIPASENFRPQPIELNLVYEDEDLLVINKPVGLVVHPAPGNSENTLLNALLYHVPLLKNLPRAGIIHRLDKDTSGLLVIAKSLAAHTKLVADLQARAIHREYEAIVVGVMTAGGTIDAAIGRNPKDRKKMAVIETGKPAITHYRVIERFRAHTHIKVILETGRTHQIRVHMAYINYPIVGDKAYGGRLKLPKNISEPLREAIRDFKRQALHAKRLEFMHPISGKKMQFKTPLPKDMQQLIKILRHDQT